MTTTPQAPSGPGVYIDWEGCDLHDYRVTVNGSELPVYHTDVASFVLLPFTQAVTVVVEPLFPFGEAVVRPLSRGIAPERSGNTLEIGLDAPERLSLELDGNMRKPLFILADTIDAEKPSPSDPNVVWFGPGEHRPGAIEVASGQTVYLEEGAFVHGFIHARGASGIAIRGRGILCGSELERKAPRRQMIKLTECSGVSIEGITVLDGPNWHVVPIACRDVAINGINVITIEGTGDGIDVVGSENVMITGCFIRSNDDCVAVKAVDYQEAVGCADVRNVLVTGCVFWNAAWGNALEIGYETRCGVIENVLFKDCDVIHCEFEGWQSGGTFTIHNGDRAIVRNILYKDIRVEDSREKLIDIKILHSNYSRDPERGQVNNVRFEDIDIVDGPFPVSIIRGFDADHLVTGVTVSGLTVHGKHIKSAMDAKMVVELARDTKFE